MVAEGEPAPDFSLEDQEGRPQDLSGFRGAPLVLYFYPQEVCVGRRSLR